MEAATLPVSITVSSDLVVCKSLSGRPPGRADGPSSHARGFHGPRDLPQFLDGPRKVPRGYVPCGPYPNTHDAHSGLWAAIRTHPATPALPIRWKITG